MRTWRAAVTALLVGMLLAASGCGQKVSEDRPMTEVKAEAEKMSVEQLRASAKDYLDAIKAQQAKLGEVPEKLKEIKVTELLSDKAKAIQADAAKIGSSVTKLQERLNVYLDALKEKGQDISGLK